MKRSILFLILPLIYTCKKHTSLKTADFDKKFIGTWRTYDCCSEVFTIDSLSNSTYYIYECTEECTKGLYRPNMHDCGSNAKGTSSINGNYLHVSCKNWTIHQFPTLGDTIAYKNFKSVCTLILKISHRLKKEEYFVFYKDL